MNYKFKDGRLFIGVLDKNGSEVYDGDRVMVSGDWQMVKNATGTVRYISERAMFAVYYDTPDLNGKSCADDGVNYNWDSFDDLDEIVVISEAAGK